MAMLPCGNVTMWQCYHVAMLPCGNVTMWQCYHVAIGNLKKNSEVRLKSKLTLNSIQVAVPVLR